MTYTYTTKPDVLQILILLENKDVSLETLLKYCRGYSYKQIRNATDRMLKKGLISRKGSWNSYDFSITESGIDFLKKMEKKKFQKEFGQIKLKFAICKENQEFYL